MKLCNKCNFVKHESSFSKDSSRKDGLQSICKDCKAPLKAKHYKENKQKCRDSKKSQNQHIRKLVLEAKSVPCKDCRIQYGYWVMQFDHLRDKEFHISSWKRLGKGLEVIEKEIAKCEVVCANCHANRTYRRQIMGT